MAYFMRPSWNAGSAFNSRREPPPEATTHGNGHWVAGEFRFIASLPLVAHDRCTEAAGTGGAPWDPGRESFSELAGADWCWAPLWTDDPERAPDCFYCGEPCVGTG